MRWDGGRVGRACHLIRSPGRASFWDVQFCEGSERSLAVSRGSFRPAHRNSEVSASLCTLLAEPRACQGAREGGTECLRALTASLCLPDRLVFHPLPQKSAFVEELCGPRKNSWRDPARCCDLKSQDKQMTCFNIYYLRNVAVVNGDLGQGEASPSQGSDVQSSPEPSGE